jgi:hypothetical protein
MHEGVRRLPQKDTWAKGCPKGRLVAVKKHFYTPFADGSTSRGWGQRSGRGGGLSSGTGAILELGSLALGSWIGFALAQSYVVGSSGHQGRPP